MSKEEEEFNQFIQQQVNNMTEAVAKVHRAGIDYHSRICDNNTREYEAAFMFIFLKKFDEKSNGATVEAQAAPVIKLLRADRS